MKSSQSFNKQDLTKDLYNKIMFYNYSHSSGIGGLGSIQAFTEDGYEYFVNVNIRM